MKNVVRIFALLLALLMVASCFIACKKDDEGNEGDEGGNNVISTSGEYQSKLPDMDWGGSTYLVLGMSSASNLTWENFEISRDEMPDDTVGKAVWERNDAIKQRYGIIVEQELADNSSHRIQPYYASNEHKYDLVLYQVEGVFGHAQSGFLLDLNSVEYIDLEHPSWNEFVTEQFTFNGKLFCTTGDFLLQDKGHLTGLYYNREMARDAGDGYLEDLVTSGQWTLDKFNEIVKAYGEDTSGDGAKGGEADTFGLCGDKWYYLCLSAGAGYRASTVKDGIVEMAGAGDNILNILDKVGKVFFDSSSTFITESVRPLDYARSQAIFRDGRALMYGGFISEISTEIADITFEMGILPFPKYDADQAAFYSQVNPKYSTLIAVPKTVIDSGYSGFGVQALNEASTDTTYNAYIEVKCKLQDSFDQRMSDMYSLIFENPVYDLVILGDFGNITRAMMEEIPSEKNSSRYATYYSKRSEAAEEEVKELMDDFALLS